MCIYTSYTYTVCVCIYMHTACVLLCVYVSLCIRLDETAYLSLYSVSLIFSPV